MRFIAGDIDASGVGRGRGVPSLEKCEAGVTGVVARAEDKRKAVADCAWNVAGSGVFLHFLRWQCLDFVIETLPSIIEK
ncbi:hypothetical protein J5I95_19415 [Candidatus Poribacteria bacterium]|nr:hypothetical protein [Candidatus Poribacteria bacterium]